ncbi:MAG: Stk1 family PASTA domain-containing Ser/Thr kinase [Oscillospiraceae bacterium]|nr:Stk1 family PASTA domain-containing Ser/Thr kinase [Oscillospiraceae bacterium]
MNNYENLINTLLDDRYKLTGIAGIGGMAVVYEADDLVMHRKVAVKVLKDDIKEDIREVKRFINESKAVAMLSHPNIVQIYDVSVRPSNKDKDGETENYQYIVMEFIDGITLKDYIIRKGKLNWREAISYTEQILTALNHAHEKGIIHRDVKPQNVMLLRNGTLKIMDFGIAKMPDSEPLTMTDKAIGTVHYISPEQAKGTGTVSNISDIYSVGVILYEMTTGKLPFNGNTAIQVAMMQINDTPQNPRILNPEIPKGLSQIILKAMNKSPEDRYQTAREMIKHLHTLLANPAVVFNNMQSPDNNVNGKNAGREDIEVLGKESTDLENIQRKNNEISEGEMRRRGRVPQKKLKRRGSRSMLPIISGVTLAFLIVLGISAVTIAMNLIPNFVDTPTTDITIPDFVGKVYDDTVKAAMANNHMSEGDIKYETNDKFGANQIISQTPLAKEVKKLQNSTDTIKIDLVISKGKDSYTVEDLSIQKAREVELMLQQKMINVERIPQADDTVPSGYIIYTDPGPGAVLNSGDTIKIYESTGQDITKSIMPNVVGMSQRQAQKALSDNQIAIKEIVSVYSDTAPGYIVDQDIPPLRSVPAKSTRVTLKVSMGPVPTEPPPTTEAPADGNAGSD